MTEAEITATFSGMTLDGTYLDGTFFTETYHDDGSIRYWDAVGADSGEWEVKDGQFCTFYDSQQGACFTSSATATTASPSTRRHQDRRDRPRRVDVARLEPGPRRHLPHRPRGRALKPIDRGNGPFGYSPLLRRCAVRRRRRATPH